MIEPGAFVLLLESSGLVLEFTRKLMRRVRKELADKEAQLEALEARIKELATASILGTKPPNTTNVIAFNGAAVQAR